MKSRLHQTVRFSADECSCEARCIRDVTESRRRSDGRSGREGKAATVGVDRRAILAGIAHRNVRWGSDRAPIRAGLYGRGYRACGDSEMTEMVDRNGRKRIADT